MAIAPALAWSASVPRPTFRARHDYVKSGNSWVQVADVDSDGVPDLIMNGLTAWFGSKAGTFTLGPTSDPGMAFAGHFTLASLRGNGVVDAIVAGQGKVEGPNGVGVCLGNGDGTFQPAVFYPINSTDLVSSPVVADFNNDGIPDVATVGASGVWLFTGKGGGALNDAVLVPYAGTGSEDFETLATADFNGDGFPDLVVPTTSGFAVLLGEGNGAFTQESFTFPFSAQQSGVSSIATGDLTLNGCQDIVLVPYIEGRVALNVTYVYLGNCAGGFSGPTSVDNPGSWSVAVGDVSGDGIPDIVTSAGYISVGKGNGTFKAPVLEPVAFSGSYDVVLADLRNNGLTDIVSQAGPGVTSVLLNKGKGQFEDGTWFSVPGAMGCAAPADYNGDGRPDLAIATSSGIAIVLGTGEASAPFTTGPTLSLSFESCPIEGDFNGDGIPDLMVVNETQSGEASFILYLGNGDGTFTYKSTVTIATSITLGGLALGDFNRDGNLDFALATNWMVLGNGDGTFQTPTQIVAGTQAWAGISTGDINGDGWPDLVLYEPDYSSTIDILLNNQKGGFTESTVKDSEGEGGNDPYMILLADLNGDGRDDMVVSQFSLAGATVYMSGEKGKFAVKQNFTYPIDFQQSAFSLADVNGDSVPDLLVLNAGSLGIYLGKGNGTFEETPFFIGPGEAPGMILTENLHGRPPRRTCRTLSCRTRPAE